jgi:hypothetical protein
MATDKADSTADMNAFAAAAVSEAGQTVPALKVLEKTTAHIKCMYNDTFPVNFHFTGIEWMIEFDQQVIPVDMFVELKHAKIHNSGGICAQFNQEYMPYIVQFESFKTLEPFMVAYEAINSYIFDNLDNDCGCSDCDSDAGSEPELELSEEDEEEPEDESAGEDDIPVPYGFPCDTGPEAKITALVTRELTKTNLEHLMIGLLIGALFPFIIRFYNGILFR